MQVGAVTGDQELDDAAHGLGRAVADLDRLGEAVVRQHPVPGDLDGGIGSGVAEVAGDGEGLGGAAAARRDDRGRGAPVDPQDEPVHHASVVDEQAGGLAALAPGVDVAAAGGQAGHRSPDRHLELVEPRLA